MKDIVVFVEEPSARIVTDELSKSLGLGERTLCIEHQGKSDLERSFPRKMQNWGGKPRFIVLRDNDGADCVVKKAALTRMIPSLATGRAKVRLAMQELESWYIGDPMALTLAGLIDEKRARSWSSRKSNRNPDSIRHAKQQFRRDVGHRGQIELARLIGPHLEPDRNLSLSFRAFVAALRWAAMTPA